MTFDLLNLLATGPANTGSPQNDLYQSPLTARYATRDMSALFSRQTRILTWRRLWLALAESQKELGLVISSKQIDELKATLVSIDFESAARYEKELRHDVMAHVKTWGDTAPSAKGILHLGATSAFIVDNADLIIMHAGLHRIAQWLANTIDGFATFAQRYRDLPTLGFTHFQPAQITTVGKRAALWCYDFVRDLKDVEREIAELRFRGVKGATGTQASFLELFNGDHTKVVELEKKVAQRMGFEHVEPITGQTYSRKVDARVLWVLGQVAISIHKFANDLRLLAHLKEVEEPFEQSQVGSSSMPYKRNPMLCERATSLARHVIALASSAMQTAAEQWLERTLDDSAGKRICVPEAFLATDGMLRIMTYVSRGMVVYPKVIDAHLQAELPFLATENILMAACAKGGDRQELHERLRCHTHEAAARVKQQGEENDLLDRLQTDSAFGNLPIDEIMRPSRFIGRAPEQVDEFLQTYVAPIRSTYTAHLTRETDITL